MSTRIYMATTTDAHETPLFVTDKPAEMAEFLGCSLNSFYSRMSHHKSSKANRRYPNTIALYSFRKEADDEEET